ncbi:retrotransposon protein, putative, ty1-copia subclass [Tanacetum coccineum]
MFSMSKFPQSMMIQPKKRLKLTKSTMMMQTVTPPDGAWTEYVSEGVTLESLNIVFDDELSINIILSGLPADYNQFVISHQMNGKDTSIIELHSLLQTAEQGIKKIDVPSTSAAPVLTGLKESRRLKHGELNLVMGNRKITHVIRIGKYELMLKSRLLLAKAYIKTVECISHNGNVILNVGSSKELDKSKLWHSRLGWYNVDENDEGGGVGCGNGDDGSHRGGFRGGDDDVATVEEGGCRSDVVAAGQKSAGGWPDNGGAAPEKFVEREGACGLKESRRLKHGEINLVMGNRKITLVTRIGKYELMLKYRNGDILVYSNGCFMFKASPCKGIYESGECISHNGNVILNVGSSNDLDKSKLWHSRLGHINKKRIAQLQKDGVLESFNFKSDDVCESCLLGKITKSPFTGSCERDTFEVFKMYQNEVENQLGKKIKLTPPRTPQLNRDDERRNKTLLDMDSGSKIDLEEIQETGDEEPIVNTDTQQEVEAMASPKAAKWKEAIKSEIQSMYENQVWNLVDTIPSLKTVGLAKIKSIRIMLAIAAFHDYDIWKMNVKTAFLNGKLTEDEFMAQPKVGTSASMRKSHSLDFLEAKMSPVYVSKLVGEMFHYERFGDAAYILGIKIYRDRSKRLIGLSQDTYLDKILKRFKSENSKKGNLPLHHGIKISKDLCPKTNEELDRMSRVPYALAVGSIMYAMTYTRPNVSFALSMVSRHQQNPDEGHWKVVKNILKYLRNSKDRFLVYNREEELRVTGYYDTSWQTDKDDSRSQSGWVFLLNGGATPRAAADFGEQRRAVADFGEQQQIPTSNSRLRRVVEAVDSVEQRRAAVDSGE